MNKGRTRFVNGHVPWNKGKKKEYLAKYYKKGWKIPHPSSDKHYKWKGGISKGYREQKSMHIPEYKSWRSKVFERDNWTCQTCGKRGCYLEAHHIKEWAKFPELRFDINNGVTLCYECHRLTKKVRRIKSGHTEQICGMK
jgi:5-methylcytosine-specific restriction endonuclease McrA